MTDPRAIQYIEAQDKARTEKIQELNAKIAWLREENAMLLEQLKSACIAVRKLAPEVTRLREAISEFVEAFDRDPIKYADLMDRTREAVDGLYEIAREGE